MASIATYLQRIKNAIYGEEVRDSIHDAINAMNTEVEVIKQIDVTVDHTELVDARTGADGKVYNSTGDAVRDQITNLQNNLSGLNSIDYLDMFATRTNVTNGGVTFTWDGKTCSVSGTAGVGAYHSFWLSSNGIPSQLSKSKDYIVKFNNGNGGNVKFRIIYYVGDEETIINYDKSFVFSLPSECTKVGFRLFVTEGDTVNTNVEVEIIDVPSNKMLGEAIKNENAFELYTNFASEDGAWTHNGSFVSYNYYEHSELLKIRGGVDYYFSANWTTVTTMGMFFDKYGDILRPLSQTDISEYAYRIPDATGTYDRYVVMYKFTAPENAEYVSINFQKAEYRYRVYLASKPIFAFTYSGNLIIKNGDKVFENVKERKLCVIGTSQVMIDRLIRTGNFDNNGTSTSQYVVGFQEYLMPWWNAVDSYGYSDASMAPFASEGTPSLFERIVSNHLDLTGYDDFLLTASSSGLSATGVGTLTSYTDLGDENTYIGALRQIIDYIYTQNPYAKIYVQTRYIRANFSNSSTYALVTQANEATREMCKMLSLPVIDCASEEGFNYYTAPLWCYDENGHHNQIGNKVLGLFVRKKMLGV